MALAAEQFLWLLVSMGLTGIVLVLLVVYLYKNREGK